MKKYCVISSPAGSEPRILATYYTLRAARKFADFMSAAVHAIGAAGEVGDPVLEMLDGLSPRVIDGRVFYYSRATGRYHRGGWFVTRMPAPARSWAIFNVDNPASPTAEHKLLRDAIQAVE